jgi:hypothetical protein
MRPRRLIANEERFAARQIGCLYRRPSRIANKRTRPRCIEEFVEIIYLFFGGLDR